MKSTKSSAMKATKKKLAKDTSGDGVSDSLWANNPSLAASLALVPFDSNERNIPPKNESTEFENKAIPRSLPPALVELKTVMLFQIVVLLRVSMTCLIGLTLGNLA